MIADAVTDALSEKAADPLSYTKAILNILGDLSEEKTRLQDTQRAILNILEDAGAEKKRLEAAQKATLNILDDFAGEKARLETTQRAMLNVLDDFDGEKNKVEQANREMSREIDERKQAEVVLRHTKAAVDAANRELEAFSYSVSHDLRAPLRSLDGFSRALVEDYGDRLDETATDYLNRIRAGAQRMGGLIDDLLQLSRMTRMEMHPRPVDLTGLAQSIVDELGEQEPHRNAEVTIDPNLTAQGDLHLLRAVLQNLLGNAWKYTGHKPSAHIRFGVQPQGGELVYFVQDDGAGFDMAYVKKLFGAFQRLHTAEEFEGNGIGLATVQRIIHRHGGRVWAEGAVNGGATFYFTLAGTNVKGDRYDRQDDLAGGGQRGRCGVDLVRVEKEQYHQ